LIKQKLRAIAIEKRRSLPRADYWNLNDQIIAQFKLFNWSDFNYVHLFLPIKEKNEVDTFEILSFFKTNYPDLKIVVPRTHFAELSLAHVLFDHEHTILRKNKHQIPEPLYGQIIPVNLIDVVIVPLLTFDLEGNRVGYGAGFYDRFLRDCRPDILKIGLSFYPPENDLIDTNEFDIKLTHCITPHKTYVF
jgi:5-formyltetrahydrofolate cyclo-ligase